MNKLQWGILSTAKIGTEKVIPAMQRSESAEIVAIASRDQARASHAATQLGIPHSYGSYEAILSDERIEAVYIPLPNHMHVSWAIRSLEHGKHVLCEKPIGLSVAEAQSLIAAGKQHDELKLMEAFMYRHHPQWRTTKELVDSGAIGELRTIQTFFSYFNDDPHNIRNRPELGGGALMDIGCYPISLSRWLMGEEPEQVTGKLNIDPVFGVDRSGSGLLEFTGGRTSSFTASMEVAPFQRVQVVGTSGRIEIEIPFNAPPDRACRLWKQDISGEIQELEFAVCDQYAIQGDLFAKSIRNQTPVPTPIEDAVANMRVIEAMVASDRANAPVALN